MLARSSPWFAVTYESPITEYILQKNAKMLQRATMNYVPIYMSKVT